MIINVVVLRGGCFSLNQKSQFITYIPLTLKSHEFRTGFRTKVFTLQRRSLLFIGSGHGVIYIQGQQYTLRGGTLVILNPDEQIQIINNSNNTLQLQLLHYEGYQMTLEGRHILATSIPSDSQLSGEPVIPVSHTLINTVLAKLKIAMDSSSDQTVNQQLYFLELLQYLHNQAIPYSSSINNTIPKTIRFMEEHYAKPIPMNELPLLAGMTQSSYCRAFKKMTGISPGQYLTKIRILRAKELMLDRRSTLREIALQVGYQDELYFSRIFKKAEGMSPSAYIQRKDKRIVVISRYLLQDHLLALGIQPIAAPAYPKYYDTPSGFPSYLHPRLQGTIPLHADRTMSSQEILSLSPDLVFKMESTHPEENRELNSIGNTLFIDPSTSWEDYFRDIAKKLDATVSAERTIQRMEQLEVKAKKTLAPLTRQGSWAIIRILPNDLRLYGAKDHTFTELFYQRLQFQADKTLTHSHYASHAFNRLLTINPDNILILWSEQCEIEAIQNNAEWSKLKAVQQQRVFVPDSREWDPWGPIGRQNMIQSLVKFFVKTKLFTLAAQPV